MSGTEISSAIESARPSLLRFARMQLRNDAAAEDAVQETVLAALESNAPFAGRSAFRTWLFGILRHKIIDHFRRLSREPEAASFLDEGREDDFEGLFARDGHWQDKPQPWGDPAQALEQERFFKVLEYCVEGLPPKTARAFMMREVMGLETEEICKALEISSTNCWVVLHRARMRLRECLDKNWFGSDMPGMEA